MTCSFGTVAAVDINKYFETFPSILRMFWNFYCLDGSSEGPGIGFASAYGGTFIIFVF